jgi:CDP-glucose 4,6-dehydratase
MINYKNKPVLVTGGSGFIGKHLVKRLRLLGADVSLLILDEEKGLEDLSNCHIYRGNIQDAPDVSRIVNRVQPEYIFHLASQPLVTLSTHNVLDTLDSNIRGTINLFQACVDSARNIRGIVHVSTDKVYGNLSQNATEDTTLYGIDNPYDVSKVCADYLAQMYAKAFNLPIIIARSGNIFGEGDIHWDRLIPYLFKCCINNSPIIIRGSENYYRDFIYVDDIVDAYLILMNTIVSSPHLFGRAINFGAERSHSVGEIVHKILELTNKVGLPVTYENRVTNEILSQHLVWDWAKELGWTPKTPLDIGLENSYRWYKHLYE